MNSENINKLFQRIEWAPSIESPLDDEDEKGWYCPYCLGDGVRTVRRHEWWCLLAQYMQAEGIIVHKLVRSNEREDWKKQEDDDAWVRVSNIGAIK